MSNAGEEQRVVLFEDMLTIPKKYLRFSQILLSDNKFPLMALAPYFVETTKEELLRVMPPVKKVTQETSFMFGRAQGNSSELEGLLPLFQDWPFRCLYFLDKKRNAPFNNFLRAQLETGDVGRIEMEMQEALPEDIDKMLKERMWVNLEEGHRSGGSTIFYSVRMLNAMQKKMDRLGPGLSLLTF
uniref:Uncharacterized protein n=1 Tax=Steinernema glaseri TaxID=37863 RepID=A0A1I7Z8Y0_9BILA